MKLTDSQLITAIFNATMQQLPRLAVQSVDGGHSLTPDDWPWMAKAIQLDSASRTDIICGLSSDYILCRIHQLVAQGHLETEANGQFFTYWLPDEQLGQCWFRVRSLLRSAGIPYFGEKPTQVDIKPVVENAHQQLLSEFTIQQTEVYGGTPQWRVISNNESAYRFWYSQPALSIGHSL